MGVLLCAAVLGCPSVEKDPPIEGSSRTIAVFAPNSVDRCASKLPFPTDLSRNPATGLLNLPFCADDSAELTAFKTGLNTLDGFSLNTTLTVEFTAPIDESTLDGAVTILNDRTGITHPIGQMVFLASDNLLTIFPERPFDENTTYRVLVSNVVRDANGGEIIADQVFTLLKSDTALVDSDGYSVIALDDNSAASLEALRLSYQPVFQDAFTVGVKKENLIVAWSFTTQRVAQAYDALASLVAGGASATLENSIPAADHPLLAGFGIPTTNLCQIHTGRVTLKNLLTDAGTFGAGLPTTDEPVDYILFTPNPTAADCSSEDLWDYANLVVFAHALGRCKNNAVTVANSFGAANWAVLALDGPRAGARTINGLGDQDLDTCPDQPATPELIALGDESPNPFGVRDRLRQWGLEIVQTVELAKTDVRLFAETSPSGDAPDTTVGILGHSWGGMAALLAGRVTSNYDVMAVTGASGDMGAIFTPLLRAGVIENLAAEGITDSTDGYAAILEREVQTVAQIYTWALEPADPLYAAQRYPALTDPPGDTDIRVLAQVVAPPSSDPGAALHYTATQTTLATVFADRDPGFALANVTFTLTCDDSGTEAAVCDESLGVVGAPLVPCDGDATAALAWTTSLQTQLVSFMTTSGATTPPALGTAPACTP
jgi:pimeloyl-ACP methyl ester carboxylesterase